MRKEFAIADARSAVQMELRRFKTRMASDPLCDTVGCRRRAVIWRSGSDKVFCRIHAAKTPMERRQALVNEWRGRS